MKKRPPHQLQAVKERAATSRLQGPRGPDLRGLWWQSGPRRWPARTCRSQFDCHKEPDSTEDQGAWERMKLQRGPLPTPAPGLRGPSGPCPGSRPTRTARPSMGVADVRDGLASTGEAPSTSSEVHACDLRRAGVGPGRTCHVATPSRHRCLREPCGLPWEPHPDSTPPAVSSGEVWRARGHRRTAGD